MQVVPATRELGEQLAAAMRPADANECQALDGRTPLEAVGDALANSSSAWAALWGGRVGALWGVAPLELLAGVDALWLLTSTVVDEHRLSFARLCRAQLEQLLEQHRVLVALTDSQYTAALEWARRLGFVVEAAQPIGVGGAAFHRIVISR